MPQIASQDWGPCGPPPTDSAGTDAQAKWLSCYMTWRNGQTVGNVPIVGGVVNGVASVNDLIQKLGSWLSNPLRPVKLVVGLTLIIGALLVAFVTNGDVQKAAKTVA